MSEKSKNILLGVLIVGLVSMTVAYAALSTSLTINGTANVAETKWDIHFANVTDVTTNSAGSNELSQGSGVNEGTVTSLGKLDNTTIATGITGTAFSDLAVSLQKPGDWVKVTFDIVNAGTIDAKLADFSKTITKSGGTAQAGDVEDGITYTVKCANAGDKVTPVAAATIQEIAKKANNADGTVSCELEVKYNELTNQNSNTAGADQTLTGTATSARTFTLGAQWQYVQK